MHLYTNEASAAVLFVFNMNTIRADATGCMEKAKGTFEVTLSRTLSLAF